MMQHLQQQAYVTYAEVDEGCTAIHAYVHIVSSVKILSSTC